MHQRFERTRISDMMNPPLGAAEIVHITFVHAVLQKIGDEIAAADDVRCSEWRRAATTALLLRSGPDARFVLARDCFVLAQYMALSLEPIVVGENSEMTRKVKCLVSGGE